MKVYVLYLLLATSSGPQYHDIGESYRTLAQCRERAVAMAQFSVQSHGNVLGATCKEAKA